MILIPAGNASAWTGPTGNNTWLLPGPPSVLIDAGIGQPDHLLAIERRLEGRPLDIVLLTHGHVDHAGGLPALSRRWPDLIVRGGTGESLSDGEIIQTGAVSLRALHTPGHSPDHFCFFDEAAGDLWCGDLARIGGTVVIPASRGGDLGQYLESLRRVRALRPARLLPAHGPSVADPAALIDEYIAHREMRTQQVRRALADGCREIDAIVRRIYPSLPSRLQDAARETVRAHLRFIGE